ncbi:MAG: transglycosylase SLT domain-containing protein, partial [Wenzhouxiangellaceae bacterium]
TRCRLERARVALGDLDGMEDRVRELWLSPVSQPDRCDPLFRWWQARGHPDADTAWRRFGLAVEAGERALARYLRRYLPEPERFLADGWLRISTNPRSGLNQARRWPDQQRARTIVAWGLHRLAARDWQHADALQASLAARFNFSEDEIGPALRRIALFRAVDLDPGAIAAIDSLAPQWVDQQLLEWRARVAMATNQWREVLESIQRMPPDQRSGRWRYWQARALLKLGDPRGEARMAQLAGSQDYYGFLASLRLNRPLRLCGTELKPDGALMRALATDPETVRALELHRTGLDGHARRTWSRLMQRLNRDQRIQAALLAASIGWHDTVIHTLNLAGATTAYPWRFPLVERERVGTESSRHGIDPALVMGLMRAESAMQVNARSPAGARGLLQLMPGTAREVANRHGIGYRGAADLYRAAPNIALGTAHLGELNRRFGGEWALVAAAYNAGIRHAERWRDERPGLDRDVWIETLSFHETRDYIPRVLAFATIYEWQLGRAPTTMATHLLDPAPDTTAFTCPDTPRTTTGAIQAASQP